MPPGRTWKHYNHRRWTSSQQLWGLQIPQVHLHACAYYHWAEAAVHARKLSPMLGSTKDISLAGICIRGLAELTAYAAHQRIEGCAHQRC